MTPSATPTRPMAKRPRLLIVGCGDVGLRVLRLLRGRYRVLALTSSPARRTALRDAGAICDHTFVVFYYGVFPGSFEKMKEILEEQDGDGEGDGFDLDSLDDHGGWGEIPDHLKEAGELRIAHGQASLEELGSLASPPMTKDAIAGRIRRLLAMADKRAAELGIPDTESGLSPDLLN